MTRILGFDTRTDDCVTSKSPTSREISSQFVGVHEPESNRVVLGTGFSIVVCTTPASQAANRSIDVRTSSTRIDL